MYLFRSKTHKIRKLWANSMIKLIDITIEETGQLDPNANVIALNHNSMLDIILFDHLHSKDIAWVANDKLSKIPLFGLIFTLPRLVLIDPLQKTSLKVLLNNVQKETKEGRPVGVFPEGTRGDTNDMIKFKVGTKLLVEKLNLSVQPIILVNTRERLDTKTYKSSAGIVKIIYLNTINISNLKEDWYDALYDQMRTVYEAENNCTLSS